MMSWRSLSPKTIVAAAEAVAQRKADSRDQGATASDRAPAAGIATPAPRPVNDMGAASPPTAAE
jgi:hypothetical protein